MRWKKSFLPLPTTMTTSVVFVRRRCPQIYIGHLHVIRRVGALWHASGAFCCRCHIYLPPRVGLSLVAYSSLSPPLLLLLSLPTTTQLLLLTTPPSRRHAFRSPASIPTTQSFGVDVGAAAACTKASCLTRGAWQKSWQCREEKEGRDETKRKEGRKDPATAGSLTGL